jgi:hypothetical protein
MAGDKCDTGTGSLAHGRLLEDFFNQGSLLERIFTAIICQCRTGTKNIKCKIKTCHVTRYG